MGRLDVSLIHLMIQNTFQSLPSSSVLSTEALIGYFVSQGSVSDFLEDNL